MCAVVRRSPSLQSVDRAVSVMEFLSRRGWSGVTEVARELDIHKSTAYRLLTTLRDRGLVEQDAATEKYRLGFGMVLLARSVSADLDILRCARPVCERLSERTKETVTIAVLEGDDAVVIHQSISRASALSVDWTGRHTPLHATAAGKIFLVYMPEDQRQRILEGALERFTEYTIVDPASLNDHIREDSGRGVRPYSRGTGGGAERGRGADPRRRRRRRGRGERVRPGLPLAAGCFPRGRRTVHTCRHGDLSVPGVPGLRPGPCYRHPEPSFPRRRESTRCKARYRTRGVP